MFTEYLFTVKNKYISDQQRLSLFLLLSEEYSRLLKEKDIQSMTILGQETIEMITNTIYDKIGSSEYLKLLDKGQISHEIRRFFFAIRQIVVH